MEPRIFPTEWKQQSSGCAESFGLGQKTNPDFDKKKRFSARTCSLRLVLVFLAVLVTMVHRPSVSDTSFADDVIPEALKGEAGTLSSEQISEILSTHSVEQLKEQTLQEPQTPGQQEQPEIGIIQGQKAIAEIQEEGLSSIEKLLSGQIAGVVSTRLVQFGYDVFRRPVSTFAPVTSVPVGPDYPLGPGDNFTVTLWGRVNAQYSVAVDRNGKIVLPEVGVLEVGGMTFGRMEEYLEHEFSRKHTDFKMAVTMGSLRTIRVYVVGEAQTPGSFTLSSLSTVINAVFAAGGPSKNGTLREIRLLRAEGKTSTIDLYEFLLGGDKSKDVRLQDGDTIFISLIGTVVGVAGNVKRPAIYEMSEPMTLAQVLDLAGGVTYAGWLQRVQVERIDNHKSRIVVDFDISQNADVSEQQALETIMRDGDVVKIFSVSPFEQNVVHLEGHVVRPGKYELKPGLRLRDILSSYEVLQAQPNLEYGEIVRLVEPDYHRIVIPFNVGELLEGDESENTELTRFDKVRIFRWDERIKSTVSVSGFVYEPNEYRLVPNMRVSDLVNTAGGLMKNAYLQNAEITRMHVTQEGVQTEKIDVNLEKALSGDPEHNIALQDYDYLVVRPIPELEFDRQATITGEVKFAGRYPIQRGETLSSLIERAGGFTDRAYLRAAVFTRESAKAAQQKQINELIRQMEENILSKAERTISGVMTEEEAQTQAPLVATQKELLTKLRSAKAEGRVVLRLSPLDEFRGSRYDLELEPDDALLIPKRPGFVSVVGEVYNPASLLYEENRTVSYYLNKVGGATGEADKKHLNLIKADGSVASISQKKLTKVAWDTENNRWFFGDFMSMQVEPGDTLVVPRKLDRLEWLRNTKDITQVLFQVALATGVVLAL